MKIFENLFLRVLVCSAFFVNLGTAGIDAQQRGGTPITQRQIPFTITKPGAYYLVDNLIITDPNITAIHVLSDDVVIDLNGFTIKGPGKYSGDNSFGINCEPDYRNVAIYNGTVDGFGNVGIHLVSRNSRAENLRVSFCMHGIFVSPGGMVKNCQLWECSNSINAERASLIIGNTINLNDNVAIQTWGGTPPEGGVAVIGNNISQSGIGIIVWGQGCRIEGNTITLCLWGIDLDRGNDNLFAKNFLQGIEHPLIGESDDIDGGTIDPALSNIIR